MGTPPLCDGATVQHLNDHFRRHRSVTPKLERLDPRQRKRFDTIAAAGWWRAHGIGANNCFTLNPSIGCCDALY